MTRFDPFARATPSDVSAVSFTGAIPSVSPGPELRPKAESSDRRSAARDHRPGERGCSRRRTESKMGALRWSAAALARSAAWPFVRFAGNL
jgi:hypothetical protein